MAPVVRVLWGGCSAGHQAPVPLMRWDGAGPGICIPHRSRQHSGWPVPTLSGTALGSAAPGPHAVHTPQNTDVHSPKLFGPSTHPDVRSRDTAFCPPARCAGDVTVVSLGEPGTDGPRV